MQTQQLKRNASAAQVQILRAQMARAKLRADTMASRAPLAKEGGAAPGSGDTLAQLKMQLLLHPARPKVRCLSKCRVFERERTYARTRERGREAVSEFTLVHVYSSAWGVEAAHYRLEHQCACGTSHACLCYGRQQTPQLAGERAHAHAYAHAHAWTQVVSRGTQSSTSVRSIGHGPVKVPHHSRSFRTAIVGMLLAHLVLASGSGQAFLGRRLFGHQVPRHKATGQISKNE